MDYLINKIINWITPTMPASEDTVEELKNKTEKLEQQADLAESEAKLLERSLKAKKRIKVARKNTLRPLYILGGLVGVAIIILIMARGC